MKERNRKRTRKLKRRMPVKQAKDQARHDRFVLEYLIDFNGTRAAIATGYSKRSAYSTANRLLRNAEIIAKVEAAKAEAAERAKIRIDDVVKELAAIAFANMGDYMRPIGEGDEAVLVPHLAGANPAQIAAVSSLDVTEDIIDSRDGRDGDRVYGDVGYGEPRTKVLRRRIKFKLHDKITALVNLGRHLGGFGASINVNTNTSVEIKLAREEMRTLSDEALDAIIAGVAEAAKVEPDEDER